METKRTAVWIAMVRKELVDFTGLPKTDIAVFDHSDNGKENAVNWIRKKHEEFNDSYKGKVRVSFDDVVKILPWCDTSRCDLVISECVNGDCLYARLDFQYL